MSASNSVKESLENNNHTRNPDDESDDTPTPTPNPDEECADSIRAECGIGTCQPAMLQMCATMPVYTGFYSVSALMTSTLSSYVNSQVTTLEKHFGFSSTQTGLIMAANDVGFLAITLFVSFMASRVHIPRALASFTILFGVSGIVCALPYFLFGAPSPTSSGRADVSNVSAMTSGRPSGSFRGQLCDGDNQASLNCSVSTEDPGVTSQGVDPGSLARAHAGTALVIIVLGMILQGVAKTPRYSFTVYYVDNNVEKVKTGFYMGIIITVAIMGPALAYALGALFTRIYVTLEDTDLTFRHPKWIGAWWLGYVTFGCGACVFALPLFLFPRRIKGGKQQKPCQTGDEGNVPERLVKLAKGFLEAMIRLWTNPVYMFIVLANCCILFAGAGSYAFFPKYIENQFDLPAWKANIAMAGIILGTACVGTFVGGYLTKRLKMGPMGSVKFTMGMTALSVVITGVLIFVKCDQPYLYNSPGPRAADSSGVEGCMDSCVCDDGDFFPVCGQDGRTFFSPCHAGCLQTAVNGNYVNCTCVEGGTAVAGMCDYSCAMFYPFIICCCVSTLFGTLAIIPKILIYIRSVEERDKALALGFSSFMTSVLGWMLGPIVFGKWIDGICIQWERGCTGSGACRLYDNDDFRWKLMGFQLIFRAMALVFLGLNYISARVSKRFETSNDNRGEMKDGAAKMTLMGD